MCKIIDTTTVSGPEDKRPLGMVNRDFSVTRPNQLWVADFTYVATWIGFVYVAFIIDVFSRMIVGWRASNSMKAELTLDALEQAFWARQTRDGLIHHNDRGSSYDNAMAETINGLYKTEVIRRKGPWKNLEAVEDATLEWVSWFNTKRLPEPLGYMPPAEFETAYYKQLEDTACGL